MGLLSNSEKQKVMRISGENRTVTLGSLAVKAYYLTDPKALSAWHRLDEYLREVRTFGKKAKYMLPIHTRSAVPISPYSVMDDDKYKTLTDPDQVALASHDYAGTEQEAAIRKTRYYDWISIAIMGMVIIFGICVVLILTGKIKLG